MNICYIMLFRKFWINKNLINWKSFDLLEGEFVFKKVILNFGGDGRY